MLPTPRNRQTRKVSEIADHWTSLRASYLLLRWPPGRKTKRIVGQGCSGCRLRPVPDCSFETVDRNQKEIGMSQRTVTTMSAVSAVLVALLTVPPVLAH